MKARRRATRAPSRHLVLQAVLLVLLAGCDHSSNRLVDRVHMISGDNQCALPGQPLPEPLVVRVLGPRTRDFLGREGPRSPAVGVEVAFMVEDLDEIEAPGEAKGPGPGVATNGDGQQESSDLGLLPYPRLFDENGEPGELPGLVRVVTDRSGVARARVQLGSENGDWRIEAVVTRSSSEKQVKEHFRLVTGVEKLNEVTEANVGEEVPLELHLAEWVAEDDELRDLEDREVYFRVVGQPSGVEEPAEVKNQRDQTNKRGIRDGSKLTLGDRAGIYYVLAEVEPYREPIEASHEAEEESQPGELLFREDKPIRGILFRIVAMDWPLLALKIIGGALVFLIGVRFFGSGCLLILSPHLPLRDTPWTGNRLLGYVGGVAAGTAFQSWSTVSSHLASFANGGFLTARSGLMPLLGASVGATVLPQLLSLELSFLSVPLLAAGILLLLLPRTRGTHSWGWASLGLGLVFASWTVLSDGIGLLALSGNFRAEVLPPNIDYSSYGLDLVRSFFAALLMGLAAGFFLRTSNLIVVFAILMTSKGLIDPSTAIPLICGANLGAALMIFAASVFKLQEGRRIGLTGLVFHFLTALAISLLSLVPLREASVFMWLVEALTPGALIHPIPESVNLHLAMAHTLYNLLGSLFFLLFPASLMRIVDRLLPPRKPAAEVKPYKLDANLIPVPSLALGQVTQEVIYLTELCQKSVAEAFDSFRYADLQLSDHLLRRGETISGTQRDVARFLVLVSENELSRHDANRVEVLQSAVNGLVGIAGCAERIRDLASRRVHEKIELIEDAERDLGEVYDRVISQFDNVVTLLQRRTSRIEENALKQAERIAVFKSRLEVQARKRIEQMDSEDQDRVGVYVHSLVLQDAFEQLFFIASHLAHIAERMRLLT